MLTNQRVKLSPYRDKRYLQYIRDKGCVICGQPSIAHHIRRSYWGSGMGIKPHDYVTIPLCNNHHDPAVESDLLIERLIIDYLMEYIRGLK